MKISAPVKYLMLSIAILIGAVIWFCSSEWNRAAFASPGHIESGKKFGISIGEDQNIVQSHLARRGLVDATGFDQDYIHYNPQSCHGYVYPKQYKVELWVDHSWRRGTICLAFHDGKLAKMSWWFIIVDP